MPNAMTMGRLALSPLVCYLIVEGHLGWASAGMPPAPPPHTHTPPLLGGCVGVGQACRTAARLPLLLCAPLSMAYGVDML